MKRREARGQTGRDREEEERERQKTVHAGSARAGALPRFLCVVLCVPCLLRDEVRNLKARLHRVGRGDVSRRGFGGDESDDDDCQRCRVVVVVTVVKVTVRDDRCTVVVAV